MMLILKAYPLCFLFFKCTNKMGRLRRMLFLSFFMTPFVDSEDTPASTNGVTTKDRNNKLCGDRAQPTSTNVLIYKMGWPSRLLFLAPFHISCNPDINKVGNRSYMSLYTVHTHPCFCWYYQYSTIVVTIDAICFTDTHAPLI